VKPGTREGWADLAKGVCDLRKLSDVTDEQVEQLIAARRHYYTEALAALDEPTAAEPSPAANDATRAPAMTEQTHGDPAHAFLRAFAVANSSREPSARSPVSA
jgi:hypothetical protein